MHSITAANLRNAHGGETMAHMRYRIWEDAAVREGYPNVARLFRAISSAEIVHATNHFRESGESPRDYSCSSMGVFGLGNTSQNLAGGIMGETYEVNEMYPAYLEVAKFQGEKKAERSFHYALEGEKTHAAMFRKAKEAIDANGRDIELEEVHVCLVCGWTHEGGLPERCPVCGAGRSHFQAFPPER